MTSRLNCFSAALVLACWALASSAQGAEPVECQRSWFYPDDILKQGEGGIVVVGLLVRADGTSDSPVVMGSSGSADIDNASRIRMAKCTFKPHVKDGKPIDTWIAQTYVWPVKDDPEFTRAKRSAASAAKQGHVDALYHLSRLLRATKKDEDRQKAQSLLIAAAERGDSLAQFDLALRYEKGIDLTADPMQAQHWYEKSAAQRNVFALQRMQLGELIGNVAAPTPQDSKVGNAGTDKKN
jgi:TonB family protein